MRFAPPRSRPFTAFALTGLLLAAACSTGAEANTAGPAAGPAAGDPGAAGPAANESGAALAPLLPLAATTTAPPPPPPEPEAPTPVALTGPRSAPGLPQPAPLPSDPRAPTPDARVGRISIPKLGLDTALHAGMTLTAIDRGPSHWPGTALPGEQGNVVVGGHRVTHSKPFRRLDELSPGDPIVFSTDAGEFTYLVTEVEVVNPDAIAIADQTPEHTATLFACHPPGSARFRIVAKARLAGS